MASATRPVPPPMALRDPVVPRPTTLMRAGVQELVRLLLADWRSNKQLGYCWEFTDAEWVHELIEADVLARCFSVQDYLNVYELPSRVRHSVLMLQRHGRLPMMPRQITVYTDYIRELPYEDRYCLQSLRPVMVRLGYRFGNPALALQAVTTHAWLLDTNRRGDTIVLEGFDRTLEWVGDKVLEGAAGEMIRRGDAPGSKELWAIAQEKKDPSALTKLFQVVTCNATLLDWAVFTGLDLVMRHANPRRQNWHPKTLADCFEALLSAVKDDCGNDHAVIRGVLTRLLLECPVAEYNKVLRLSFEERDEKRKSAGQKAGSAATSRGVAETVSGG